MTRRLTASQKAVLESMFEAGLAPAIARLAAARTNGKPRRGRRKVKDDAVAIAAWVEVQRRLSAHDRNISGACRRWSLDIEAWASKPRATGRVEVPLVAGTEGPDGRTNSETGFGQLTLWPNAKVLRTQFTLAALRYRSDARFRRACNRAMKAAQMA